MQGAIKDVQKDAFQTLINQRIPEIIREAGCELGDCELRFEPLDASNYLVLEDQFGTVYHSIKAVCFLTNKKTNESVEFNVELLRVPVLQELGFKIKGNYMQQLDVYERAVGWNFYADKSSGENASLIAENKRSLYFVNTTNGPRVRFLLHGEDKKAKISISTFFRAVSGYSNEELISLFGYSNPYVIETFGMYGDNSSIGDCVRRVASAIRNNDKAEEGTVLILKRDIETDLFSTRYFPLGSNATRLNHFQSYSYRADGKSLAEDIDCNGYHFEKDVVLSTQELEVIDKLPLKELKVEYNGKLFTLRKFSTFTFDVLGYKLGEDVPELSLKKGKVLTVADVMLLNDTERTSLKVDGGKVVTRRRRASSLCMDDLFTAFGIWTDNLNGFDLHSKQFEITNRVLVSYDKRIETLIRSALGKVTGNVEGNLSTIDYDGQLAVCVNECYAGIDVNAFIDSVSNAANNSGQMSDMCNLLAYVSKSNKTTANLGAATSTDEMVNVQDMQEGRLDPLDVPESDKIGSVHYRTMLSKLDDEGNPTTPFLRVVKGEVVSDEPVYLTAMEQTGVFIAQWDETFHDADGNLKKRVKSLCNGNVQSVEIEKVTYKEYSPYQNLSPAHSMIPFPGHSNGKRIAMGCNQVKQAVPLIDNERPVTMAGGESLLDVGCYTAYDVLKDFYSKNRYLISEDEETVMNSNLILKKIHAEEEKRILTFRVESVTNENNEAILEFPYLFRTFEATMFSYKVNPKKDNIYHGNDVVAYNNGYSIEKKPLVKCADFGAQTVSDSVFDKGVALTKNLNVVYKTYGGSVIEDGITISSKLVYDDSLTHIGLFEIKEVATKGKTENEYFRVRENAPEYLGSNGLPRVGTYLKPGMVAISKVCVTDTKTSFRYTRVGTYVEGQVISAKLITTQKGTEARVILAQRSYVQSGDKMAGRCGNKGVIAKIAPETEMPFVEDTGEVADVVLNPLGIPSRQNITQLLEAVLSYCMKLEGKIGLVTPYNANDVDFIKDIAARDGVKPRIMIDGRTGLQFERPANFCVLPMYKLHHVSKRKIHSVGMDAKLDSTFLQPTKGSKRNGGQSFGEMETWCVESVGATALLHELFTLQSDDIEARNELKMRQNAFNDVLEIDTNNSNDLAMQACYRSLGVEFSADEDKGEYTFEPIRDSVIKSLFPTPITTRNMLHADFIFGSARSVEDKAAGRNKWGWIDLHCKMILPIWIYKGGLPRVLGLSAAAMKGIVQCETYVKLYNDCVRIGVLSKDEIQKLDAGGTVGYETGMPALVHVFENYNVTGAEIAIKAALEEYCAKYPDSESSKKEDMLKIYRARRDFNQSGFSLSDYVVSSFPVMPQTYRAEIKVAGRSVVPDFDWFYTQILHAASEVEKSENSATCKALFNIILEFTGLDDKRKNKSYKSLLTFFCAKGQKKHHGKIRENVQSKRIMCSGRCAIKPAEDYTRTPLEIGIPFTMMTTMYAEQIFGFMNKLVSGKPINRKRFDNLMRYLALRDRAGFDMLYKEDFQDCFATITTDNAYSKMTKMIKSFLEGRDGNPVKAVGAGRQPSLHKYSVRVFRPYIVYDNVAHLHPLLCKGFNADFDGDQMYFFAIQTQSAIDEALEKLSPAKDFILPKNGSVVLEHSQDIVLGVYCATMLENNGLVPEVSHVTRYYCSTDSMWSDYYVGSLKMSDVVSYRHENGNHYLSTAGRILFNRIVPGSFTDETFSNQLMISGINADNYRELCYDGLVGNGSGQKGIKYFSLPEICKRVYEEFPAECIGVYQAITEFGFIVSDRMGVSLSIFDFDINTNKQQMLDEAEKIKSLIEQDYQDGLISEKDKRNAIIALYNNKGTGVNEKILKDLLDNLPRNNNIFIMMDSGARGNKSQLMQMCGAVGILQKSKTEDLETSVTRNYYDGLNSFDVHLASYSARTGVASTQNETKRSGYATHKVVYMASGIQVVENDCGCTDFGFDIEWDEHDESKDRFMPSMDWFKRNMLGKEVDVKFKEDAALADGGRITENSYAKLTLLHGFHELHLKTGVLTASIFDAKGAKVIDENRKYLRHLPKQYVLDLNAINSLLRQKVRTVETEDGVYTLRYNMSSCCKSLLTKRVGYNLPSLKMVYDPEAGEKVGIITDDTIEFIENNKLDRVSVRTTLKCKSKHGICAHCYGLQFSNSKFPLVGDYVGTESAQSIAEPASQLTLNVINKGGTAGASSVSSGVQVFEDLLGGSKQDGRMDAVIAGNSGYIDIERVDTLATVRIMPEDINCVMCTECRKKNRSMVCPKNDVYMAQMKCTLLNKIPYSNILQSNGEWVNAGEKITNDMIHPDSIVTLGEGTSQEDLHVKKQRVWINNYYNTFKDSGISIYARHFELIANVQNRYVEVRDAGCTDLELGKVYEFNEVADKLNDIRIKQFVSKRSDVVLRNSGAFAALSFENVANVAANLVVSGYKESAKYNHSLISSLSIGENLKDRRIKKLNKPVIRRVIEIVKEPQPLPSVMVQEIESVEDVGFSLQGLNLEAITSEISSFNSVEPKKMSYADFEVDDEDDFVDEVLEEKEKQEQIVETSKSYNTTKGSKLEAF